ncbi:hypothetical protein [Hymenobacter cellulosilyticus]|uniref:Uncharacterized protein n=1 Tax=Hymenobacter cellulosilyticus TaxID=2932248 RepID=A0A8T9Q0W9_9BACT|nr:hypothetical protein [Hymenobacter cellulosilyticus]UOQ70051.1 hypothetical protein MUN79_14800 [Hymenobacter cellulosilyticus]
MAKYESRFDNFFLNLRLNRAQFGDMAGFTLQALRQSTEAARYEELIKDLDAALTAYSAAHTGQLSGEAQGATVTVAQALLDFRAYVKRVERRHVTPTYDEFSADIAAIFPKGRAALTNSIQARVLDAFGAFLIALASRPAAFPAAVRAEGQEVYRNLKTALELADAAHATSSTHRTDLHDGREATCRQLFRAYATLLLTHYEYPTRVAGYFDLSRALISKSGKKAPAALQPQA